MSATAEIIAIGSELTCGSKLDTNSQWLSRELESLGWTVTRHTTLADDLPAIVAEFRAAAARAGVLLITGGLGPTLDDITRDALADAFEQPLVRDPESVRQIEALFAARGRSMPERNYRQADRPQSATALPNSCGTAPGILMQVSQVDGSLCRIAAMPGVPAEMKPMFEQQVKPLLVASGTVICRKVIRTFGYGESEAERILGDLTARGRNPEVGITASEAVISLWITARSNSESEAEAQCRATSDLIRQRLGEVVYAESDAELQDVVADLLNLRRERVIILEGPTTGGLISQWLTESVHGARVVERAEVIPDFWPRDADPEGWQQQIRIRLAHLQADNAQGICLMASSPFQDVVTETGIAVRRGWVVVASPGEWQCHDVSMSGNLAIFRQRAARTALNRLRLMRQTADHPSEIHAAPAQ